jgi:2-aminobenzoate-CoA ligase
MEVMGSAHVDTFTRDHLPARELWPDLTPTGAELRYPARLNCADELLEATIERLGGDRLCVRTDDETWTYEQLRQRANQVARVLVDDHGFLAGNRVLLRGPNNPWAVACWLGVMKAGGVAVSTMPLLRATDLRPIIDKALPTLALCDWRFRAELDAMDLAFPTFSYGGDEADDVAQVSRAKPIDFESVATAADDVCLIAFTSGTTGVPKGCMHFHRDVLAIADTFSHHVLRPHSDDLFVASPPMAFTFGLGAMLIFPLRCGAATLLLERSSPELLAEAIARHRATVCATAPTAYRAMLKLSGTDFGSLRRCVSAGETLPRATWEAWHAATDQRIIDGIGSTEMLHIFIAAADGDIRPGSTGRAVPGYEARVVGMDGEQVDDGHVGRLAVRGPTGCRYLNDKRQTEYVQRGWNLTGDAYIRDADGYFWFQARDDDMIVSSGYNIAGPEVEDALLHHSDVMEAAVIGVPDPDRGAIVKAYVVLRDGVPPGERTVRNLQDFVKAEIAPYKYPRAIKFVDTLPRTPTGKLQRYRLREENR